MSPNYYITILRGVLQTKVHHWLIINSQTINRLANNMP